MLAVGRRRVGEGVAERRRVEEGVVERSTVADNKDLWVEEGRNSREEEEEEEGEVEVCSNN